MYSWHIISHFLWFPSRKLDCACSSSNLCMPHVLGRIWYAQMETFIMPPYLYWPQAVQPTEVGGRTTVFLCHAGSIERVQSFYWVCNVKNWAHIWADNWGSQSVKGEDIYEYMLKAMFCTMVWNHDHETLESPQNTSKGHPHGNSISTFVCVDASSN
jgi:hypothetical protein